MKKKFVILFFIIFMNKIVRCGEVDVVTLWAGRTFIVSFSVAFFVGIGLWNREDAKRHELLDTRLESMRKSMTELGENKYQGKKTSVEKELQGYKSYKRLDEMSIKENIINFLSWGMKRFEAGGK